MNALREGPTVACLALTVTVLLACRVSSPVAASPALVSDDTAIFSAVVGVARDSASRKGSPAFEVDPRPLRSDTSIRRLDKDVFVPVGTKTVAARVRVIDRLGIARGVAELPARCVSVSLPVSADIDRSGCPRAQLRIAALTLPMPAPISTPRASMLVHTIEMALGPLGWSIESYNYIMRPEGGTWLLWKRINVSIFD